MNLHLYPRSYRPRGGQITVLRMMLGLLVASLFASAGGAAASGSEMASDLSKQFVDMTVEKVELEAATELSPMLEGVPPLNWAELPDFAAIPNELRQSLQQNLSLNVKQLRSEAELLEARQEAEVKKLKNEWKALRESRIAGELALAESEASGNVAGYLALLVTAENRWFWLAGFLGVGCLGLVAWHDRRHEYRRRLNGVRARALGLARAIRYFAIFTAVVALTVFLFGPQLYTWLIASGLKDRVSPAVRFQKEVEDISAVCDTLRKTVKINGNRLDRNAAATSSAGDFESLRTSLARALAQSRCREALAANLISESQAMDAVKIRQQENAGQLAGLGRKRLAVQCAMATLFIVLILFGAWRFLGDVRRRAWVTAHTCPLCLGFKTLQVDENASGGGGLRMLRCTNVISQAPLEECDFRFPSLYQHMSKLCFPTLGHPQSGKTHWLAMAYRELNRGNFDSSVRFERIKSVSSQSFDEIVDSVLSSRFGPMATQTATLPRPLVFHFSDNDRFGASNLLVNMFDFNGEVTTSRTLEDVHRRRALTADGFFFFLDPTLPGDIQNNALINFRDDIKVLRQVRAGQAIHTPVALCVSKIDLLVTQPFSNPGGGDAVAQFYKDLERIDPTGEGMSLRVMEEKSELMQQLCDTIWPGWNIARQIRELFGGRFLFFPLTPVGLAELGEMDLRQRTIEPYGILQPIIWLLHMNGYKVAKDVK